MKTNPARRFLVPRARRLTCDVMHFHRQVPICPHDRRCRLGEIDALRRNCPRRLSWSVLMLKAYGLAAQHIPELRQTWLNGPVSTIYEHPASVGMLAITREFRGEPWLFWGRFLAPETTPLEVLQKNLERYQTQPVEQVFHKQVMLSGIPNPLRRLLWWWNLNVSGAQRARRAGTFVLTTLAGRGAEITNPPSFHTGNFTYGPMDDDGFSRMTLAYDHRLFDGALAADALARIEDALHTEIANELRTLTANSEPPPDSIQLSVVSHQFSVKAAQPAM